MKSPLGTNAAVWLPDCTKLYLHFVRDDGMRKTTQAASRASFFPSVRKLPNNCLIIAGRREGPVVVVAVVLVPPVVVVCTW